MVALLVPKFVSGLSALAHFWPRRLSTQELGHAGPIRRTPKEGVVFLAS
jgi:hypothetical protein